MDHNVITNKTTHNIKALTIYIEILNIGNMTPNSKILDSMFNLDSKNTNSLI